MGDGKIGIADAVAILKAVAGLVPLPATMPGEPPSTTVLLPEFAPVDVSGAVTKDVALPDGFLLTGRLLDAQGVSISGSISLKDAAGKWIGSTDDVGQGYKLGVAPAAYNVSLERTVSTGNLGSLDLAYTSSEQVSVSGDTVKDLTFPATPKLNKVTGTVTLANTGFMVQTVQFQQTDNVPLTASSTASAPTGSYEVDLPAGTYHVRVTVMSFSIDIPGIPGFPEDPGVPGLAAAYKQMGSGFKPLQFGGFTISTIDLPTPVVVAGDMTANLSVPLLVKLSGKVTMADNSALGGTVLVMLRAAGSANKADSSAVVQDGAYSFYVLPGTYDLSVNSTRQIGSAYYVTLKKLVTALQVPADTVQDLVIPVFAVPPSTGQVSGKVTDTRGKAVGQATVSLNQRSADGQPSDFYIVGLGTTAGADGTYSLQLPAGAYVVGAYAPGELQTVIPIVAQ
jgi:hypothetical protein